MSETMPTEPDERWATVDCVICGPLYVAIRAPLADPSAFPTLLRCEKCEAASPLTYVDAPTGEAWLAARTKVFPNG